MTAGFVLATVAGLGIVVAFIAYYGFLDVAVAIESMGWGVALTVLVRAAALFIAGFAWRALFPRSSRPDWLKFVKLRFIREGINVLLPVATVGGDFVGARLIAMYGVPPNVAGAVMLVDLLVQAIAQYCYTIVGVLLLVSSYRLSTDLFYVMAAGFTVGGLALTGFFLVQRSTAMRGIEAWMLRIGERFKWDHFASIEGVHDAMRDLHRNWPALGRSFVLHFLVWLIGSVEIWVALKFTAHPVSLVNALVMESIVQAMRGLFFPVPGALGVQEGSLLVLGTIIGVPQDFALAVALVKRVPDVVLGLPAVLYWQYLEGSRFLRRRRRAGP